jgi:hypothetical protein
MYNFSVNGLDKWTGKLPFDQLTGKHDNVWQNSWPFTLNAANMMWDSFKNLNAILNDMRGSHRSQSHKLADLSIFEEIPVTVYQ